MSPKTIKILRLAALATLVAALVAAGTRPTVRAYFELEYLRSMTSEAGFVGVATFLGLWVVSYLMQIPGLVFVVAALLAWGTFAGSAIAFVGLTFSAAASFWFVRSVGGSPVADIQWDWVRNVLDELDDRPIRTVALLRTAFLLNPVVNLSLVLTDIRFRHYLVGSMLGFVIPLGAIALATETVLEYMIA